MKDATLDYSSLSSLPEHSKLHNSDIANWLKKRHQVTANPNYIYLPKEIQTQTEVRDIFNLFDEDKSGKLGLVEFYKMLHQAGIKIDIEDLRIFFKKVDVDHDTALDFTEFKNCTLSHDANMHFGQMMDRFRGAHSQSVSNASIIEPPKEAPLKKESNHRGARSNLANIITIGMEKYEDKGLFIPRTFGTLLNFLAYHTKKNETLNIINDRTLKVSEKYHKFGELLDLQMDKDLYLDHINEKVMRKIGSLTNSPVNTPLIKPRGAIGTNVLKPTEVPKLNFIQKVYLENAQRIASRSDNMTADIHETNRFLNEVQEIVQDARTRGKEQAHRGVVKKRVPLCPGLGPNSGLEILKPGRSSSVTHLEGNISQSSINESSRRKLDNSNSHGYTVRTIRKEPPSPIGPMADNVLTNKWASARSSPVMIDTAYQDKQMPVYTPLNKSKMSFKRKSIDLSDDLPYKEEIVSLGKIARIRSRDKINGALSGIARSKAVLSDLEETLKSLKMTLPEVPRLKKAVCCKRTLDQVVEDRKGLTEFYKDAVAEDLEELEHGEQLHPNSKSNLPFDYISASPRADYHLKGADRMMVRAEEKRRYRSMKLRSLLIRPEFEVQNNKEKGLLSNRDPRRFIQTISRDHITNKMLTARPIDLSGIKFPDDLKIKMHGALKHIPKYVVNKKPAYVEGMKISSEELLESMFRE